MHDFRVGGSGFGQLLVQVLSLCTMLIHVGTAVRVTKNSSSTTRVLGMVVRNEVTAVLSVGRAHATVTRGAGPHTSNAWTQHSCVTS